MSTLPALRPASRNTELCFTEQPGAEFGDLTFPRFRHLLSGDREDMTTIGVRSGDSAVGLALLFRPQSQTEARLLSVMVVRGRRGEGIARSLLARVEAAALMHGHTKLSATHSSRLANCLEFERLTARSGWTAPEINEMRTAGYAATVAAEMDRLEAARRPYLPDGASLEAWSSVTEDERSEVAALAAAIDFSAPLSPSLYEGKAHPELSLVLRHEGKIAGWVFGECASEDFCHYGCGYVVPALRRRGALIGLIREVCRKQAAMFGAESVAQLSTTPSIPGMPRFMKERLGPCSLWYDEIRKSSKDL